MARHILFCGLAVLFVASTDAAPAAAQSAEDFAAYVALISTPAGGLAPTPPRSSGSPSAFQVHYGYMSEPFFEPNESTHHVAVGGDVRAGAGRFGLTAGYIMNCGGGGCASEDRAIMLGASGTGTLFNRTGEGTNWSVGASGSVGYMFPTDNQADFNILTLSAGLPVALRVGTGGQIVPFVVPAVGWGRVSSGGAPVSGVRFLLGGGLGFATASGSVHMSLGFQKVFIREGATLIGVEVAWGPSRQ